MALNILVQGFCPLKIKITQFPYGLCLKLLNYYHALSVQLKITKLQMWYSIKTTGGQLSMSFWAILFLKECSRY